VDHRNNVEPKAKTSKENSTLSFCKHYGSVSEFFREQV